MNKTILTLALLCTLSPAWSHVKRAHHCNKVNHVTCAVQNYFVPPGGRSLTHAEKSFLPRILSSHPFYNNR